MNWYFYYPENCSRYPELSNQYYNYYNSHPESNNYNSISRSVYNWRVRNSDIVTDDWDKDNAGRVQRFKEYGWMETDRKNYNLVNSNQKVSQSEYLQKSQNKFPTLASDVSKKQLMAADSRSKAVQQNLTEPVKVPVVKAAPAIVKQNVNSNQIRNAQEYHQNVWQQMQSQNNSLPARQQQSQQAEEKPERQNYSSPSSSGGGGRRR
jgi:hypothetical protein